MTDIQFPYVGKEYAQQGEDDDKLVSLPHQAHTLDLIPKPGKNTIVKHSVRAVASAVECQTFRPYSRLITWNSTPRQPFIFPSTAAS